MTKIKDFIKSVARLLGIRSNKTVIVRFPPSAR